MTRHGKANANSSTGEGSSSRISDSVTIGTTQRSGEEENENSFAGEIVGQIESVVESFRTGSIKKAQAIFKIGEIITRDPRGDEQIKSDSLDKYAITLDEIETLATQSNERGLRYFDSSLGKRKDNPDEGNQRHEELDRDNAGVTNPIDVDGFFQGLSEEDRLRFKADEYDDKSKDDSDKESNHELDERGQSNKKQRIYESQMPWFSTEQRFRSENTNPSCNKTRDILELFQRDPVAVKRWVRCAASAPAGFPSSEWDSLIKGESVDLDTVFSSLHHIRSVDENIGRVGATEIQFGRPKPAAKVETSGQWTSAFNLVIKATAFLFPHRYDELRQYEDYIEELFSAKSTSIHPKLFKYDEAIRYKVGQGQNILLTNRSEFTRYYEAIVAPDGIGSEGKDGGNQAGSKKGGKSGDGSEICNRFNGAKGCSLTADKCKYKHICKKCKNRGHGKLDCKVEEGV